MVKSSFKRPQTKTGTSYVTTPRAAAQVSLLGPGNIKGPVTLTRSEFNDVKRLYLFEREPEGTNNALMQAAADRNAFRHAEADGLRLLAWISRFVPAGEDPLKTLVEMAAESGCDVDPEDVMWADEIDEEG